MRRKALENLPSRSHSCSRRTCTRTGLTIRSYDGLEIIALSPFLLAVTTSSLSRACCNLFSLIDGSLLQVSTIHRRVKVVGQGSDCAQRVGGGFAVETRGGRGTQAARGRRARMPTAFRGAVRAGSKILAASQRLEMRTESPAKRETGRAERACSEDHNRPQLVWGASNKR